MTRGAIPSISVVCALLAAAGLVMPACGGGSSQAEDDGRERRVQDTRDRADRAFDGLDFDTVDHDELDRRGEDGSLQPRQAGELPTWVFDVPVAPGAYYYAMGTGYFQSTAHVQIGLSNAQNSARAELARTVRTEIESASQRFSEQVLRPDGTVVEQSWSREFSRAVTDQVLVGAHYVDMAYMQDPGTGGYVLYALLRISFADVAESMRLQVERDLERPTTADEIEASLLGSFGRHPDPTVGRDPGTGSSGGSGPSTGNGSTTAPRNGAGGPPTTRPQNGPPTTRPHDRQPPTTTGGTGRVHDSGTPDATADRVRRWVEQRSDPNFPDSEYMIGVGLGPNVNAAVVAGRQELLAFFSARLDGVTRTVSESLHRVENQNRYIRESIESMSAVQQTVAGTLSGWQVAGTGQYHGQHAALVVINRADFLRSLRSRIEQNEREIREALELAERLLDQGRAVYAMRTLAPTYKLQSEVLTLIGQHNLVSSDDLSPSFTIAQIEGLLLGLADGLTMVLRIEVEVTDAQGNSSSRSSGDVVERIQRSLTSEGSGIHVLQPSSAIAGRSVDELQRTSPSELAGLADGAAFLVVGRVEANFNQMTHGDRFYEYAGTFDLSVIEVATGEVWRISDQSGRYNIGRNQAERQASGTSLERAANRIGVDIVQRIVRGN